LGLEPMGIYAFALPRLMEFCKKHSIASTIFGA
jgi:hypothetical protein